MDELQKTMDFAVFWTILRYCREYRLRVVAQHSKLYEQCRIEHCVSFLTIWSDPIILRSTDAWPLADSLASCESTLVIVTDDATEQTIVACWDPVMVIQGNAGQGRDEYLVLERISDCWNELRIEGVDTLDEEH